MKVGYYEAMRRAQRQYLIETLDAAHMKVEAAAALAGLNRTHFYGMMKRHGIFVAGNERRLAAQHKQSRFTAERRRLECTKP